MKTALLNHLIRISAEEGPIDRVVCRRLCLALAALAVQLNERGVVSDILNRLNAIISTAPEVILDLLTVLPEECYNDKISVDDDLRYIFADQLTDSSPQVLSFLCSFTESTNVVDTQLQLLKCFCRWIENTHISQETLSTHPLMAYILNALKSRHLFDEAVEVVISMLRKYGGVMCMSDNMALALILIPKILELRSLWDVGSIQAGSMDEDVCRSLSRLFTEMTENYLDILVLEHNFSQNEILAQLLLCAQYPWDFDIARIPLKAFYELSVAIRSESQHRSSRIIQSRFSNYYWALLDIAVSKMKVDENALLGHATISNEQDVERGEWKETIIDVVDVVGDEAVAQGLLNNLLQTYTLIRNEPTAQLSNWLLFDAFLSSLCVVVSLQRLQDGTILSTVFEVLLCVPEECRASVISRNNMAGKIAEYADCNMQYFQTLVASIQRGLALAPATQEQQQQHGLAESVTTSVSSSASYALSTLLKYNKRILEVVNLNDLILNLNGWRTGKCISLEGELALLGGVCTVLSGMEYDMSTRGLQFILEPIVKDFETAVVNRQPVKVLADNVERITVCLRLLQCKKLDFSQTELSVTHPVLVSFHHIWPYLRQALDAHPNNEGICEKICRVYKHVIKNVGCAFMPLIEPMMQHIIQQFNSTHYCSYLYVGSVIVGEFGEYTKCIQNNMVANCDVNSTRDALCGMFLSMSMIFFGTCMSLNDFEQKPDLVEEYFYLVARVIQIFPIQFISSVDCNTVIQAGIVGLQLRHREAQKGILLFFERLIGMYEALAEYPNYQTNANALLAQHIPSIIYAIFSSLAGITPVFSLDENYGSVTDVLWNLKLLSQRNMQVGGCHLLQ